MQNRRFQCCDVRAFRRDLLEIFSLPLVLTVLLVMVDVGLGEESGGGGGGGDTGWEMLLSCLVVMCNFDQICFENGSVSVRLPFFINGINDHDGHDHNDYNSVTINTGARIRL